MIRLPHQMTKSNLLACLGVADALVRNTNDVIPVDASDLRFIDPFALTLLAAAGERVGQAGRMIDLIALNPMHGGYLERMDLFRQPWIRRSAVVPADTRHDQRANLVELKRLTEEREVDSTAISLASAVLGWIPGLDRNAPLDHMTGRNDWDRTLEPLCHTFTELLQNAVTHARRDGYRDASVWVTAQYMKRSDRIHMGIVDTGCGFLGSLRNHPRLTTPSDEAAILLALQLRISCNRDFGLTGDATNAGIGLTTTYRIVRAASGRMVIVSGSGVVQIESGRDPHAAEAEGLSWQCAAIGIELARSAMINIDIRTLMPPRDIGRPAPNIRFE